MAGSASCRAMRTASDRRHPPSGELWRFCMERLRELNGEDVRERELANILGFEHSRAVRWKTGQMYVDRAEYLQRLAAALEVDTMLLVDIVAENIDAREASERLKRRGRAQVRAAAGRRVRFEVLSEVPADRGSRDAPLVLGILAEPRAFKAALTEDSRLDGMVTASVVVGIATAEALRPELVILDWDLAGTEAAAACRVLSRMMGRRHGRCRVVAASGAADEMTRLAASMAGAASFVALPLEPAAVAAELWGVGVVA